MTLGCTKAQSLALQEGNLSVTGNEGENIRAFIPSVRAIKS